MAVRVRATICVKRQIVQKNALQRNKSSISALPLSINFIIISYKDLLLKFDSRALN